MLIGLGVHSASYAYGKTYALFMLLPFVTDRRRLHREGMVMECNRNKRPCREVRWMEQDIRRRNQKAPGVTYAVHPRTLEVQLTSASCFYLVT